jgi:hypothetical protein
MIDYERLLVAYIAHVGACEGTDFLSDGYRSWSKWTDAEWTELQRLAEIANR